VPSERDLARLVERLEGILERVEGLLPAAPPPTDWSAHAFRWRKRAGRGHLEPVLHPHAIRLDDLVAIDEQKRAIDANTRQFVAGLPANNVLLTGSRGTGKSSLVKAMLVKYASKGLRLIEVDKSDLVELPDIAAEIVERRERFVVFCDDLPVPREPGRRTLFAGNPATNCRVFPSIVCFCSSMATRSSSRIECGCSTASRYPRPARLR